MGWVFSLCSYPPQPRTPKLGAITQPQVPVYVQVSGAQRPQNPVEDKPQVSVYQGQVVNSRPQGSTTVTQKSVRHPLVLPQPEIQEGPSALMFGGWVSGYSVKRFRNCTGVFQAQPGVLGFTKLTEMGQTQGPLN